MTIAAALFDVDGVLVDSKGAYIGFYNEVRAHVGLPAMDAEQEVKVFAYTFNDGFDFLIPEPLRAKGREFVSSVQFGDYLPRINIMPGAPEALATLLARGVRVGVCTNGGRREVTTVFEHFGLLDKMHALVTSDDASRPKPNPDGLLMLLEMLQVPREEAVYIGDSMVDEAAALAAGVTFWAFRNPGLRAARHLQGHEDVLAALGGP